MKLTFRKIILVTLFISIAIFFVAFFGCSNENPPNDSDNTNNTQTQPDNHSDDSSNEISVEITSVDGATIDKDKISLFVEHDIASVSLSGKVHVSDKCTWRLFSDKLGKNEIITKVAASDSGELLDGDNVFYILVSSEKTDDITLYELTLHRSYKVEVTYWFQGEVYITEEVFTGHEHALIVPELDGYSFESWETVEKQPIEKETIWENVSYYATASPKHYAVSFDYEDIESTEVVYDEQFSFVVPKRTGYEFCGWVVGENIITDAQGNSLSAWKFSKNEIASPKWSPIELQITIKTNNSSDGNVFGGGVYHYDDNVTLNAIPDLGYDFLGWYNSDDGKLLCKTLEYAFTLDKERSLETKWKVKDELADFEFDSNSRWCQIVRVKDTTLETYTIPSCVTDIGERCFENCTQLRQITIPKNVKIIWKYAFKGCANLENVYMEHTLWIVSPAPYSNNITFQAHSPSGNAMALTSRYVDYYFGAA